MKISADSLKAFVIASIIFLWSEQIVIGHTRVALIYALFLLVIIFFKTNFQDIIIVAILSFLFYLTLSIQIIPFGLYLSTPIKTILYIPVISFLLVFCFRFVDSIFKNSEEKKIFIFLRIFLKFQLLTQIIELILFHFGIKYHVTSSSYINDNIPRASGLFYEPSNIGFSLSPFIYIIIQDYKKFIKWFHYDSIIILIMIFFLSFSTTFVMVLFLSVCFKLLNSLKYINIKKIIISISIFLLIVSTIMINKQVFIRAKQVLLRLEGKEILSSKINSSSAVYIKGFEMAKKALISYPFGVGMENLQFLNKYTNISYIRKTFSALNKNNGGSLLFKIIGEYGYIGLLISVYTILFLIKASLKKENSNFDILINSFVFGFMSTFIRGPSYTVGVAIIGLSILFWIFMVNFNKHIMVIL